MAVGRCILDVSWIIPSSDHLLSLSLIALYRCNGTSSFPQPLPPSLLSHHWPDLQTVNQWKQFLLLHHLSQEFDHSTEKSMQYGNDYISSSQPVGLEPFRRWMTVPWVHLIVKYEHINYGEESCGNKFKAVGKESADDKTFVLIVWLVSFKRNLMPCIRIRENVPRAGDYPSLTPYCESKNSFARRYSNVGMAERVLSSKPVTRESISQGSTHIDRRTML